MFVLIDKNRIITAISDHKISIDGKVCLKVDRKKKYEVGKLLGSKYVKKQHKNLRVAFICNWNDRCGISTYSKFLVNELKEQVGEVKIFSEMGRGGDDGPEVLRCWERGKSMRKAIEAVLAWNPDFVIVQHEYGIFPNACFFLQMLEMLEAKPYAVCMHSVYEHLDKTVCSSAVKNTIVHTQAGKEVMLGRGHVKEVHVIPHGCISFDEVKELWNIFQNPYTIVQFGFGFFYKGVDRAIDAVHHLKTTDKKFENIFYVYLASENSHNATIHDAYHNYLLDRIKELRLEDNVVIIRGFQSDMTLNNYLRTVKLAIFPYMNNPNNVVYGASGAVRVAMANKIPVIASESHLFDDLQDIIPRPASHLELAKEIDEIFSNDSHKAEVLAKAKKFVSDNLWADVATKYLGVYDSIVR